MNMPVVPRFATETATELGEATEPVPRPPVPLPSGWILADSDAEISCIPIYIGNKIVWCITRHAANERLAQRRVEAAEDLIGHEEEATATTMENRVLWRGEIPSAGDSGETLSGIPEDDPAVAPSRTELGRRLRELRAKNIAAGGRLLTADEIGKEVAERRGERYEEQE